MLSARAATTREPATDHNPHPPGPIQPTGTGALGTAPGTCNNPSNAAHTGVATY